MTADTLTLADFILARIAEDEEWGRRCSEDAPVARIRRSRVLAECEAKRRIVELHTDFDPPDGDCYWHYMGTDDPCPTLRLLALPYADHPGYREEWRP